MARRWHGCRPGWRRSVRQLLDQWRQGDADPLEHDAGAPRRLRPEQKAFASLLDCHLLDAIEVADDIAPLRIDVGSSEPLVEFLAQEQGEERTKQMSGDGGVGLMIDRPRLQNRICSSPHCERGLGCATRRH